MVAGLGCLAAMQVALASVTTPALYPFFSLLYGAYIPLFFLPWNTLIASETRARDRGAKLAGISLEFRVPTVGAPFVGGLVAATWGFPALLLPDAAGLGIAALFPAVTRRPPERV